MTSKNEREHVKIADSKRDEELVVYSDHRLYEDIVSNISPDGYRRIMAQMFKLPEPAIEMTIDAYYSDIEEGKELRPLLPQEVMDKLNQHRE